MANMAVYFDLPDQVVTVPATFLNINGVAVDPAVVSAVVTDPTGVATTYVYGTDAEVVQDSTGKYHLALTPFNPGPAPSGLWNVVFIGTGGTVVNGSQIFPSSFRVFSRDSDAAVNLAYCSIDELKSWLNTNKENQALTTNNDYELTRAVLNATSLMNDMCGQHFYRITEARTFSYDNLQGMFTDPFVPGSITSFKLDVDGDGVFEKAWTENVDYQAYRFAGHYNKRWMGEKRPHNFIQVLMSVPGQSGGGQYLPFTWPWSHRDRVQITATWGWEAIPVNVSHATLLLATELFKMKDSPWGVAGTNEFGLVRVQSNPQIMDLISNYRNPLNTVGV